MSTERLTARAVAALTTEKSQLDVWDELVPGLAVRVGRGGSKTFIVRYRANGRQRRMKLGRYPTLSLAAARTKARKVLADAQGGEDPALDRKIRRSRDTTFGALAAEVMERKAKKLRPRTVREWQRIIDVELLPHWRQLPAGSITRRDVVRLLDAIRDRGAPIMSNRVAEVVSAIYNGGLRRGFPTVEANPAHRIEKVEESGRDRSLSPAEIGVVWKATEPEPPETRALFRLALLTAARIGSVCRMRWDAIDDADVWHIAAKDFKGRRPHLVPLSAEALAILEELRPFTGDGEWVFPSRSDAAVPYRSSTNSALRRIRKRSKLPRWTAHDFRTAFRTHAVRPQKPKHPKDPRGLGVVPYVADAVLGHKETSVGYEHYQGEAERYLLSEKREALTRWGAFVAAAAEKAGEHG